MYGFIESMGLKRVFLTKEANDNIDKFNYLTDNYFSKNMNNSQFSCNMSESNFILTRAAKKLKPFRTAQDFAYKKYQDEGYKLHLVKQIGGFNLYLIE